MTRQLSAAVAAYLNARRGRDSLTENAVRMASRQELRAAIEAEKFLQGRWSQDVASHVLERSVDDVDVARAVARECAGAAAFMFDIGGTRREMVVVTRDAFLANLGRLLPVEVRVFQLDALGGVSVAFDSSVFVGTFFFGSESW